MRQNLLDLYEIQKIDLSIREQESKRELIPKQLRDHEAAQARLEASAKQLTEQGANAEREARSLQSNIEAERDKIRKWEARLGDLRNQREYQALHRETEGQRRANRDSEEKLQELYKSQSEQAEQAKDLEQKLAEARGRTEAERTEVEGKLNAMTKVIDAQRSRRDELLPNVPKSLFHKYDVIRTRRVGQGMCLVTDGCCVGCNMRLPPQLYNTLQRANSAEQCPSCHRIVLWDQLLAEAKAKAEAEAEASHQGAPSGAPVAEPAQHA